MATDSTQTMPGKKKSKSVCVFQVEEVREGLVQYMVGPLSVFTVAMAFVLVSGAYEFFQGDYFFTHIIYVPFAMLSIVVYAFILIHSPETLRAQVRSVWVGSVRSARVKTFKTGHINAVYICGRCRLAV